MGPKTSVTEGDFFRQSLREQINLKHPLVRLRTRRIRVCSSGVANIW
jgi:hypothetical protein